MYTTAELAEKAYTPAELECRACYGPCGLCRTFTEPENDRLDIMKMSSKELLEEVKYLAFQIGMRVSQLQQVRNGGLTSEMIRADLEILIEQFENHKKELERREIP